MDLTCSLCDNSKDSKEFTKFARNPMYKDVGYCCPICKDCCVEYVEKRGNTKEALREILRLQDMPYLEVYGESALKAYQKKLDNTNVIIKKNIHTDKETVTGTEGIRLQNSIYTCYTSCLGLMPKEYINYMYSDGLRKDLAITPQIKENEETKKAIASAKRFLNKTFTKEIVADKRKLQKATRLMIEEINLHTNNTNKRQQKFRLKNHIKTLVDEGLLKYEDFDFLLDDIVEGETENVMIVNVKKDEKIIEESPLDDKYKDFINPMDEIRRIPLDYLKYKWGDSFPNETLYKFEAEYNTMKKNYSIKTAQHDKFLKMACISAVQMIDQFAQGNVAEAQKLSTIFEKMTAGGKLQPAQMSKADLAGGMNNFSEFYKTLEDAHGVIEIIPEYLKQPKDDGDFVLYCNVLYARRLMGYPDCKYEEIYDFYKEIKESQIGEDDSIEDLMGYSLENEEEADDEESIDSYDEDSSLDE